MPKSGIDHQFSRFYHTYRTIIYHNSAIIYHKLSLYPFIYYHKFIICVRDFANLSFWGWLRPQRDQVVHRFRFLGRLPGAPGGTRSGNRWGETGWKISYPEIAQMSMAFVFGRGHFCLGYSAAPPKKEGLMDRRYTFSSALPFVAYEATKCMRAPGSWVLVLKNGKNENTVTLTCWPQKLFQSSDMCSIIIIISSKLVTSQLPSCWMGCYFCDQISGRLTPHWTRVVAKWMIIQPPVRAPVETRIFWKLFYLLHLFLYKWKWLSCVVKNLALLRNLGAYAIKGKSNGALDRRWRTASKQQVGT